jgi:SAM-dependent methyltransferase
LADNALLMRVFYRLTGFRSCKRVAWKLLYEFLARRFGYADWHFMNYGYAPAGGGPPLPLHPGDEAHRYSIQLYHELAARADVAGREVLEVGSGRGGGASYVMRYLAPRRVVGLDVAAAAVTFANRHHRVPGLTYVRGDAENLPFPDASFDVVLNVESCHAYADAPRFLAEVRRVLRPGGRFVCADIRYAEMMPGFHQQLRESGMEMVEVRDITPNVLAALELDEEAKRRRIAGRFPRWARKAFEQFAGLRGSPTHTGLMSGKLVYHLFVLRCGG